MTQAETLPKPFELTAEQQKGVTKIQDDLGKDLKANTTAAVKTACELMENLGIPKQEICHLVCQRAEEWDYSEGHLRSFVPIEYKNQAQREVRLNMLTKVNMMFTSTKLKPLKLIVKRISTLNKLMTTDTT